MVCGSHLQRAVRRFQSLMPFGSRIGPSLTIAAIVILAFAIYAAPRAVADALPMGRAALPGGQHVASAQRAPSLAARAGVGYAHTERVPGSPAVHDRALGELAVSYSPLPSLMIAATGLARFDAHRAEGKLQDEGAAFSSAVSARYRHELTRDLAWGLYLTVLFPPANGVTRGLKATSPALLAIASYTLPSDLTLSMNAGARLDRSRHAVANPDQLSANDRIAAELSASDAVLLGAMASVPLAGFVLTGEWSWDLAVGKGAPLVLASPMRLEAGVQHRLVGGLFAGALLGASPSTRPRADELARIEPRVWAMLTVGFSFDPAPPRVVAVVVAPVAKETAKAPPAQVAAPEPAPAPVVTLPPGQIRGRVRSLRGKALLAQVEVMPLGQTVTTDATGAFIMDVPPGSYSVVVRAEGHETQERPAEVEQDGVTILVIDLRRSKP